MKEKVDEEKKGCLYCKYYIGFTAKTLIGELRFEGIRYGGPARWVTCGYDRCRLLKKEIKSESLYKSGCESHELRKNECDSDICENLGCLGEGENPSNLWIEERLKIKKKEMEESYCENWDIK